MDELTAYKTEVASLKTKMAQVEVKIQNCKEEAASLKKTLTEMGYKDLEEAKADYVKRTADLKGKRENIENIMKQIEAVEKSLKTKDEILAELRNSVSNVEPVRQFSNIPTANPEPENSSVVEVSVAAGTNAEVAGGSLLEVGGEPSGDDMFGDLGI